MNKRIDKTPVLEGISRRILRIVNEGRADRYMQMFNVVPVPEYKTTYDSLKESFEKDIEWAIRVLKKEDRIIWFLRLDILYFLSYAGESKSSDYFYGKKRDSDSRELLIDKARKKLEEMLPKAGMSSAKEDSMFQQGRSFVLGNLRNNLTHLLSIPSEKIQSYQFKNQYLYELTTDLEKLEKEWAKENEGSIKQSNEESMHDVVDLITFQDGWKWVLKDTEYCDLEAKAMGHCGNAGDPRPGDRILSLREPTKKPGIWRPACTFILRSDGLLSEMKGRENDKPIPKYFPYIVELLKNSIIKGIVGGGYLPTHNFSPEDLPEGVRNSLYAMKPGLMPLERYLKEVALDDISKEMFKQRLSVLCPQFRDWESPGWISDKDYGNDYFGILETNIDNFFRNRYASVSGSAFVVYKEAEDAQSVADSISTDWFGNKKECIKWWTAACRHDPDIVTNLAYYCKEQGLSDHYDDEEYGDQFGENIPNMFDFLFNRYVDSRGGKVDDPGINEIVDIAISEIIREPMVRLFKKIIDDDLDSDLGLGVLRVNSEGDHIDSRDTCVFYVNIDTALEILSDDRFKDTRRRLSSNRVSELQGKLFSDKSMTISRGGRGHSSYDPYKDEVEKIVDGITKEAVWDVLAETIRDSL